MRACADAWDRAGHGRVEWHARTLEAFGDQPLEEVADRYDLLVIDHPLCGTASRSGCLVALDELLGAGTLTKLHTAAVGPSQRSYVYGGLTWALASDAACQVSARSDQLAESSLPGDWPEAVRLVRSLGARAALPLAPAHAICSLLTLWAGAGLRPMDDDRLVDPAAGLEQLEWLSEMHRAGHQAATRWEPPDALAAIAAGDLLYAPLTFGYVSYARGSAHTVRCAFHDLPGVSGSVLGGAGIAVSAAGARRPEAAAFAAWVCGRDVQRCVVAPAGGQPASAVCWDDADLDARCGRFFSATRATMEAAWVRPREPWWPRFQLEAGRALTSALEDRTSPSRLLVRLLSIHDEIALRSVKRT
ncbi:MAG: extracellular solute-binding protein [Solirubrobacteraceae bacterium]